MELIVNVVDATWQITTAMAPFLLVGFLIAGLFAMFLSPALVERHLGQRGLWQVIKAALLGVPLPLCSCGVLPVAASLRRHGASAGATLAFLIATPQTGVECIVAMQGMLGGLFAVFVVLTAFLSGIVGGAVLEWVTPRAADSAFASTDASAASPPATAPGWRAWRAGLRFGFVTLPRDIGRAMLLGILLSGALMAFVPDDFFAGKLGPGLVSMLIMLLVGMPMYVCSAASIPVAYAFLNMGISPGAALVFLVSGPATNVAAMTTIWRILGRRALAVYLLTIAGSALAAGMLLDRLSMGMPAHIAVHQHGGVGPWVQNLCAVSLVVLLAPSLWMEKKG